MKRQLMTKLKIWKAAASRKPLLLMGARQVGKTTLLRAFGQQEYSSAVCLNFDDKPKLKALFDADLDPHRIIRDINLQFATEIKPAETLLFFDEIQECPNALNSLKYFHENANEYHVCGAGSLLGVKLANSKGFPVGKVHFETLYPCNFLEFLEALNKTQLCEYLQSLTLNNAINPAIHDQLLDHLKTYFVVGGMPEAIQKYTETNSLSDAREIHRDIIRAYDLDFSKHAPPALIPKITSCFHSVTAQLAKENKKFIYSVVREGARARNYEDAVQWLVDAGLIYKVYNTNTPKLPINAYENVEIFKVYLVDVGLLNTMADLPINAILDKAELFQEFRGSLTENFVAQELSQQHQRLHYWTSSGQAEVDVIFRHDEKIYPLEVASGYTNKKKSLLIYKEKYQPQKLLRISPQNLDVQESFINFPLYLIGQLSYLLTSSDIKQ